MRGGDLINTPGYYYAIAYWGALVLYSLFLKRKGSRALCWGIRAAFFFLLLIWMLFTDGVSQAMFLPCMAVNLLLIYCFLYLTCELDTVRTCYYSARAFILGEFTASFGWQMYYYATQWRPEWKSPAVSAAFIIVIYGAVLVAAYYIEHIFARETAEISITKKELLSVIVIVAIVFAVSNISYLYANTPFSSAFSFEVFIIRTLADLGGVAILYAFHIQLVRLQNRFEAKTLQNMLDMQYTNYQISEKSMEMVNQKYHDLKHQIAILRAGAVSNSEVVRHLDKMEQEIKSYEAQNKTGNKVLDTMLTSKSLYCQNHGIQLSCVADGAALDFMDLMDLSALFGNILDNAIENTEKVSDPKKRLIHLAVTVQKGFLRIRSENYFEGTVEMKNGLPVTTKKEKAYHGYGIKSIQSIAKKYGGSATINVKDHWFELRILFPLEKSGINN